MINSVIFQDHSRNRVIFCSEGQGVKGRSPVPYHIEKDDKADIVQIRTERTPNIAYFQEKTPSITSLFFIKSDFIL